MTQFATYRCTQCRRTKDIQVDNVRALLSHCTITKGCSGTLQRIGSAEQLDSSSEGLNYNLVDWFPRGQEFNPTPVQVPTKFMSLGCSNNAALCIASPNTAVEEIVVEFERKATFGISSQTFTKTIQTATNSISGRDDQNRTIRFEEDAISQNRIRVSLNGVQLVNVSMTLTSITLSQPIAAGDVVSIVVFGEVPVEKISVLFTKNDKDDFSPPQSAWTTTYSFDRISYSLPHGQEWAVYSSPNFSVSSDSQLRVSSAVNNEVFLMAKEPYSRVDVNITSFARLADLTGMEFPLRKSSGTNSPLQCSENDISFDAVPFKVAFAPISGTQSIATDESSIQSTKIIGPT